MDSEQIRELASDLIRQLQSTDDQRRIIIAMAGIPGSGKTFLSNQLQQEVNRQASSNICAVLPLDGFHLSLQQLQALPNAKEALNRRGAHWTFDGAGFVSTLQAIRQQSSSTVLAPTFDHAVGDPVANAIAVEPHHRVIIAEGLYLHVENEQPWSSIQSIIDQTWWVQPQNPQLAQQRLVMRHVQAGLAASEEEALLRIQHNDGLNAAFVEQTRCQPTRIIYN
ncbi:hypothetical protein LPJ79_003677 [Coemansia sp. RSA 1821]|nr:hypothetical protein LPJ68_002875 [Coemansia sp. RSA 1086]KAJ1749473.1 hypothetical protein LPJ79_003677 [Coemansia sp. RSA 1821]KAJ2669169.1 hypothetical protein IWW42_004780 [Coemansia sp. RSA 1085]